MPMVSFVKPLPMQVIASIILLRAPQGKQLVSCRLVELDTFIILLS
jgi:hypothetical protein